jgi:hypothetical protein
MEVLVGNFFRKIIYEYPIAMFHDRRVTKEAPYY